MNSHTPGPWRASPYSSIVGIAITAPTAHVAGVRGEIGVATANAHLIAAAPELEEVLDELEGAFGEQTYAERSREELDAPDDREYSVNITAKQLRAISRALSKAEGRS